MLQRIAKQIGFAPSIPHGRHSGHASVRDNLEHVPEGQEPILDREITIAEVLADAGYVSGCFGKWGLGFPGSPELDVSLFHAPEEAGAQLTLF